MRTAKIRLTQTDGSFQLLKLEIVMQRAEQRELLSHFLKQSYYGKSAASITQSTLGVNTVQYKVCVLLMIIIMKEGIYHGGVV